MANASVSFTVKSPPERVFALSKDLESLGAFIPDVNKVEVTDEMNAFWYMTTKVGFVKRTTKLHTTIMNLQAPTHADFSGDADEVSLSGSVDLIRLPDGGTTVNCQMEAHGKGPLKMIISGLLDNRLAPIANGFAQNLKQMLEKEVSESVSQAKPAPVGAFSRFLRKRMTLIKALLKAAPL